MFCFVILHYNTIDETINCINSIKNKVRGKKKIIIVDNCSPNNSGIKLKEKYKDDNEISVIINKENLGFAKGNNVGFKYSLKFDPDYICILNNDVELVNDNFDDLVEKCYEEENFAVLSPDIFSTFSKVHQSPKRLKSYSYDEILKLKKKYNFRKNSKLLIPIKCKLKEFKKLKKILQFFKFKSKNIDYNKKYYNIPVHGACIIFSKDFIKVKPNGLFDKTFMYFECEILDYECHKFNLKTVYNPDIKVLHHHSISSQKTYSSELKREKFVNECVCNSLESFIELMDGDKNE